MANVIDLFCGAGGFSKGFKDMDYTILLGVDNAIHKLKTYSENIEPKYYMEGTQYLKTGKTRKDEKDKIQEIEDKNNIVNIRKKDINKIIKGEKVDVIIGSPPCKDFSSSNILGDIDENRAQLYKEFFRIVRLFKPTWFVLENVCEFFESKEGELLEEDSELYGYKAKLFIANAKDYGVAQDRERGFLIGTKDKDVEFNLEEYKKNTTITIKDAISDLEVEKNLDDKFRKNKTAESKYQEELRSESMVVYNHITTDHKKETIENIRLIKENKIEYRNRVKDYGEVAGTITGEYDNVGGKCFNIHPKFERTFTDREAARFQSFPDDFIFRGNKNEITKQIGDAVPPIMAMCIAKMIKDISYS